MNGTSYSGGVQGLPRLGDSSLFVCPTASAIRGVPADIANDGWFLVAGVTRSAADGPNYANWTQPPATLGANRAVLLSYVVNSKLFFNKAPIFESYDGTIANQPKTRSLPASKLRPGSDAVFMTEQRHSVGEIPQGMDAYYAAQGGQANRLSTRDLSRMKADWQRFTGRHKQGGNLLFIDGHVAYFTMKDVVTPSIPGTVTVADSDVGNQSGNWNRPGSFIWDPRHPVGR